MANRRGHRGFGNLRKLASGRYQARYTGPDGRSYSGATTFDSKIDAEHWLMDRQKDIANGTWHPDSGRRASQIARAHTFGEYAETWLLTSSTRPIKPLKVRTAEHYRRVLDQLVLPTFGTVPIKSITPDDVDAWHASLNRRTPTINSHAYSLLSSIMKSAAAPRRRLIDVNPCNIEGASKSGPVHRVEPLTIAELGELVGAMPEKYRVMTLIAAWCGLRFGELTELRRTDIDLTNGVIHVRRGVVRTDKGYVVGTPKSAAGIRDVAIPPHLLPAVREHLSGHVNGRNGLLFPAADGISHLAPSTLYKSFYRARDAIGKPSLRWHDLRHVGAVLAASTGATLAELMARLGHSTAGAAMRYQHAAQGADARIAQRLSEIAAGVK